MKTIIGVLAVLAISLTALGCSKQVTAPVTDASVYEECSTDSHGGVNGRCMLRHIDADISAPLHGFVARRTLYNITDIVHIDPTSGTTRTIVRNVWSGTSPVWIPGHRAIAYDDEGSTAGITAVGSSGRLAFALTRWIQAPPFRTWQPMFGSSDSSFAYLHQWTGYYGDTTLVDVQGVNLPDNAFVGLGRPFNCRRSVNGQRMVCQVSGHEGIVLVDVMTGTLTRLVTPDQSPQEPTLSPDGRRVVYVTAFRPADQERLRSFGGLLLGNILGDGHVAITDTLGTFSTSMSFGSPVFALDGNHVAFIFFPPGGYNQSVQTVSLVDHTRGVIRLPGQYAHYARLDWR